MNPREQKYYEAGRKVSADYGPNPNEGAQLLRQALAQALKLSEPMAVVRVVADYQRRLDAVPPLAEYPELKGMRECVVAYNQGVSDGSGLSITDVMLRANFLNAMCHARRMAAPAAPEQAVVEPGCTLVYFPESDRGPLLANNNDGTANYHHHNPPVWIVANRAGVILGTVSSGLFDDEVSPQQFPAPVFMMAEEMCGTTSETVDLLTKLNLFWGPCNLLVADQHGASAVIEKSACRYGLRRSENGFSATTEMSAEHPGYKPFLWQNRERSLKARGLDHHSADWAYWKACERRSARLQQMTHAAASAPTFEKMEQIIYNHTDEPDQIHMDGSKCHPDQEHGEWSLRTTIWLLNENRAQYSFAEPPTSGHLTPRHWKSFEPEFVF